MLTIENIDLRLRKYPLKTPFTISSGTLNAIPQIFVTLDVRTGKKRIKGLGHNGYSLIWSDRRNVTLETKDWEFRKHLFRMRDELAGNEFSDPFSFYKKIVLNKRSVLPELTRTMLLSPFDLALWDAYAKLQGKNVFSLPEVQTRLDYKKTPSKIKIMHIAGQEIYRDIEEEGLFAFKIKLSGCPREDAEKVNAIAAISKIREITVDANEAYGSIEDLNLFSDLLSPRARQIILFIEQPFSRKEIIPVKKYKHPIPIFADESCVQPGDISWLKKSGYCGVTLKPHTKTFSGTLLCLDELRKQNMKYSVTDLTTAPPIGYFVGLMTAAKLKTTAGLELNGRQYYRGWEKFVETGFKDRTELFQVEGGYLGTKNLFKHPGWGVDERTFRKFIQ